MKILGEINAKTGTQRVYDIRVVHTSNNNYQMMIQLSNFEIIITISKTDARQFLGKGKNDVINKYLKSDEVINQIDSYMFDRYIDKFMDNFEIKKIKQWKN